MGTVNRLRKNHDIFYHLTVFRNFAAVILCGSEDCLDSLAINYKSVEGI